MKNWQHTHNFIAGDEHVYNIAAFVADNIALKDAQQTDGWRRYENIYIDIAGRNQPFNIQQPYITCYMWKRTA